MFFPCGTTCCLLYQRASLRYQQGCTACFTERQRDLSILKPLWQSVCRPYFPKNAGQNQTTCPQTYPFLLPFPKNAYFLPVGANLPPRLTPSLLLLIQPLDFIFYKILPALNIMMTAAFLFLPKAAHLFICLLLKPLSSKLLTPPSADKKNSSTA